jgi:hypothetical protein
MHKAATLVFSTNSISTIVNVIPTTDKINKLLTLQGTKPCIPLFAPPPNLKRTAWTSIDSTQMIRTSTALP